MKSAKQAAPPQTSRGVQKFEDGQEYNQETSLCVDWLEFTLPSDENLYQIWEGSIFDQNMWGPTVGGGHGYKHKRRANGMEIWWGSARDDAHIVISGKGCRWLEQQEGWVGWPLHLRWLDEVMAGKLSRLDVALDVFGIPFGPDEVADHIKSARVKTRWDLSTAWRHQGLDPKGGDQFGTVYLGSTKSDSMMRCYDKRRQMAGELPNDFPSWYRFEFQLRNESARAMAQKIRKFGWDGAYSAMRGYVNFIDNDGSTNASWWHLMSGQGQEPLGVKRGVTTAETTKAWLAGQVAAAVARVSHETITPVSDIALEVWGAAEIKEVKRSARIPKN